MWDKHRTISSSKYRKMEQSGGNFCFNLRILMWHYKCVNPWCIVRLRSALFETYSKDQFIRMNCRKDSWNIGVMDNLVLETLNSLNEFYVSSVSSKLAYVRNSNDEHTAFSEVRWTDVKWNVCTKRTRKVHVMQNLQHLDNDFSGHKTILPRSFIFHVPLYH